MQSTPSEKLYLEDARNEVVFQELKSLCSLHLHIHLTPPNIPAPSTSPLALASSPSMWTC